MSNYGMVIVHLDPEDKDSWGLDIPDPLDREKMITIAIGTEDEMGAFAHRIDGWERHRYKAVVKAAHHWNLWHTMCSSGVDEPEEVDLKEALASVNAEEE